MGTMVHPVVMEESMHHDLESKRVNMSIEQGRVITHSEFSRTVLEQGMNLLVAPPASFPSGAALSRKGERKTWGSFFVTSDQYELMERRRLSLMMPRSPFLRAVFHAWLNMEGGGA